MCSHRARRDAVRGDGSVDVLRDEPWQRGDYLEDRVDDAVRERARVWRETFNGLLTASPPTDTGRITAPTLVIWGERDELLPRADQEALAATAPRGRLIVYRDTGHLVLWEQPARIAADLMDFLTHDLG